MSGYISIPKFVSGQVAVRQALGALGYADSYQTMKPDFDAWIADAQDLISRLKTYTDLPCGDYTVCDNRIELPNEMAIITCASFNGYEMTYKPTKGCTRYCRGVGNCNTVLGKCGNPAQTFTLDGCYMHFQPTIANGAVIHVNGLGRPLDDEGCPLVAEVAILAVSEYICRQLCIRYRDNRLPIFERNWLKHCLRARAELNQFNNKATQNLGFAYFAVPYPASFNGGYNGVGYYGNGLLT